MRTMQLGMVAAALATGLVAQAFGAVVSAPFTDNFAIAPGGAGSSLEVSNNRASSGTSTWETVAGGTRHTYSDGSWGLATAGAYASIDNLAGTDFTMSANVKPTSLSIYAGLTGLVAASSTSNLGGWSSAYYAGTLGLVGTTVNVGLARSNSSDYPTSLASASFGALNVNTTYLMTFSGDYDASGLALSFTVTEAGNASFVPVTVTHTVLTADIFPNLGTAYGIRDEVQAGTAVLEYSNLSISATAVPEPASVGVVLFAAASLMTLRRRAK